MIILPSILNMDGGGREAWGKDQEYKNKISLAFSTSPLWMNDPNTSAFRFWWWLHLLLVWSPEWPRSRTAHCAHRGCGRTNAQQRTEQQSGDGALTGKALHLWNTDPSQMTSVTFRIRCRTHLFSLDGWMDGCHFSGRATVEWESTGFWNAF